MYKGWMEEIWHKDEQDWILSLKEFLVAVGEALRGICDRIQNKEHEGHQNAVLAEDPRKDFTELIQEESWN